MPIDPSIPLSVKPPQFDSPIQSVGALMQLRGQMAQAAIAQAREQREQQQFELEKQQFQAAQQIQERKVRDTQTFQRALKDAGGSWNKAFATLEASGEMDPMNLLERRKAYGDAVEKISQGNSAETKDLLDHLKVLGGGIAGIKALPEDRQGQAYTEWRQRILTDPQFSKYEQYLAPQWSSDWAKEAENMGRSTAELYEEALKRNTDRRAQEQADRQAEAEKRAAALAGPTLRKTEAEAKTAEYKAAHPAEERASNPTEVSLAAQVAAGKQPGATPEQQTAGRIAEEALKRLDQSKVASKITISAPGMTAEDPKDIAKAIQEGRQPPTLQGLYRVGAPVRAELARSGYDLMTAQRDWQAVQKHLSTLNGQQQERLRQAITFTSDSLDNIDKLYKEWQSVAPVSGFKVLNKAALLAAKNSSGKASAVASNLEAQIADLTSELGTVYKGGNSSTDESLRLAAENLKADWNEQTFKKAIDQIRTNLRIRRNSILTSEAVGVSPSSPYQPKSTPEAAPKSRVKIISVE